MPAGAATQLAVPSSKWDETRATRPSSHHSSRPSTRSAAHASSSHGGSGRYPTTSSERSSHHHTSSSHGDSGRYPTSSERSSHHHTSNSYGDSGHYSLPSERSSHHRHPDSRGGSSRYPLSSEPSSHHHTSGSYGDSGLSSRRPNSLLQRATAGASRTRAPAYEPSRREHGSRSRSSSQLTLGQSRAARPMGLETRLEKIEEGIQKMGMEGAATARPTVVVVQQQAAPQERKVYGSSAFCAGYMAAKRDQ